MRKTTIATGLALALTFGAVAFAQQGTPERPRAEQDQGRRGRGGPDGFLLRGITLSADQQQRVEALRAEQRKQFEAARAARGERGERPKAGERRQRGDTAGQAARRAQREQMRAQMEQRRDQHVAQLRSILTAEQHVQFDKNVAEMKQRQAERVREGGEKGRRGPRGAKGATQQGAQRGA